MSTSSDGLDNRMFKVAIRLCPPASSFASPLCSPMRRNSVVERARLRVREWCGFQRVLPGADHISACLEQLQIGEECRCEVKGLPAAAMRALNTGTGERRVKQVEVGCIGVGWIGGLRAETLSRTALVDKLHLCDIRPERLAEVKALYKPATATLDYKDIINNNNISVVFISTTPEANHYPIARDCLQRRQERAAGKADALELWEADELIMLAKRNNLKFTIGYSQRFNTKIAYAKKKITDGTLGKVVSVLVSRHLSRALGKKIAKRVRLSPVVMESTHDLDFVFWLLEPAKPVRVYSQGAYGYMEPVNGSHDIMFTTVTMDNGVVVMIGGGWNFPEAIRTTARPGSRSPAPKAR
jgi:predicted dehydrogenase